MVGGSEFYSIRVLIKHPHWSLASISEGLGEEPDHSWTVGDALRESMWSRVSWTTGNRFFLEEVSDVLDWLGKRDPFVTDLVATGGTVMVIAQLPGAINLGDELSIELMQKAVALGVRIGIEVFPGMARPEEAAGPNPTFQRTASPPLN